MAGNERLQTLRLGNNVWSEGVMSGLLDSLYRNSSITELDIHGNTIGAQNAVVLADLLTRNPPWRSLDVSKTSMQDGAMYVVSSMAANYTLRELHLQHSVLRDVGAEEILRVLCENATLRVLNVADCEARICLSLSLSLSFVLGGKLVLFLFPARRVFVFVFSVLSSLALLG